MSLPYEPGRVVFASLRRTADDLSALADGRIEELPPRSADYAHPALAHLERALFEESPPAPPALDGAVCASSRAPERAARSSSSARS